MTPLPQLLTPRELCAYLGISRRTLDENLRLGMPFLHLAGTKKIKRAFDLQAVLYWFESRSSLQSRGSGATDGPDLSRAR